MSKIYLQRDNRFNSGDWGSGRNSGGKFRGIFGRGGRGNGRFPSNRNINDKGRGNNEINKRGLSFFYKEPKESKEFEISFGGTHSEKVLLYHDHSKHKILFILI